MGTLTYIVGTGEHTPLGEVNQVNEKFFPERDISKPVTSPSLVPHLGIYPYCRRGWGRRGYGCLSLVAGSLIAPPLVVRVYHWSSFHLTSVSSRVPLLSRGLLVEVLLSYSSFTLFCKRKGGLRSSSSGNVSSPPRPVREPNVVATLRSPILTHTHTDINSHRPEHDTTHMCVPVNHSQNTDTLYRKHNDPRVHTETRVYLRHTHTCSGETPTLVQTRTEKSLVLVSFLVHVHGEVNGTRDRVIWVVLQLF